MVGDVAARPEEAGPPVRPRARLDDPPHERVPTGRRFRVPEQELEERGQVVRAPFAGRVGLAEPELPARREPAEEAPVADRQAHGRAGAEAPYRAVRQLDLERPALEVRERPLEDRHGHVLEEAPTRPRLDSKRPLERGHVRTEPSPGTNGGLRWNGTRLRHSRSACQWMSAVTWSGWTG